MFDFILKPIGSYLAWLDSWTGSYMIALLIFALTIEVLLLPLAIKQQKTSIKQAKLRPKEMAIQKKYAGRNDRVTMQKMQQELMDMRQQEGVGQFGGCLTLLIQLPIIMALYQIVINPLRYVVHMSTDAINVVAKFLEYDVAKGTIGMISKIREVGKAGFEGLSTFTAEGISMTGAEAHVELMEVFDKLPDFTVFGGFMNLGETPSFSWPPTWLLLVPVLTFVVYFLSMKLTRKLTYQPAMGGQEQQQAMGCSNTVMDIVMPLFSVYITFIVPAAVGVYWIFKSILSTIKQFVLYKAMPLPTFTEEDYKAAEREMGIKGGNKKNASRSERDPNAPRPRSLHHIDDDDYNEDVSAKPATKEPEVKAAETPVGAAPLKLDEPERKEKKKKGKENDTVSETGSEKNEETDN